MSASHKIAGVIVSFWCIAISLTLFCKSVFSGSLHFPFPIGLAAAVFSLEWCFTYLVVRHSSAARWHFTWRTWGQLFLPIGIASGLQVGFSNLALVTLAVSLQTMVRSATPVCVLLISFCLGLRRVELRLVFIVLVVSTGTALITFGVRQDAEFEWAGFFWIITSMLMGGSRLCLSQVLLQKREPPIEKLVLLYNMLPVCATALVPFFFWLEYDAVWLYVAEHDNPHALAWQLAIVVVIWAALGFMLVFTELWLIGLTSSLTFSICATCKELMLVLIATIVNHDRLSRLNMVGFAVSLSGVLSYKYITYQERQQQQQQQQIGEHPVKYVGDGEGGGHGEKEIEMSKLLDTFDGDNQESGSDKD
eukprot:g8020.t1